MASYGSSVLELSQDHSGVLGVSQDDSEAMLAHALRKMDGLIGDYSPQLNSNPLPRDPLAVSIVTQCETLKVLLMEWEERVRGGGGGGGSVAQQVRQWLPPETRQFLTTWISGTSLVQHTEQLQRQIISMATKADQAAQRVQVLTSQLAEVQLKLRESEAQSDLLSQQLQATRQNLQSRETEITLLSREREVWPSVGHGSREDLLQSCDPYSNSSSNHSNRRMDTPFQRTHSQRRSLKKTFAKAFSRKKTPVTMGSEDSDSTPHIINSRASAFYAKDGRQLGQWVEDIGLEMYRNLVEKNVPSGERLVVMTTKHESNDLMHIGIVNTLHCKKLRLAVEGAITATPTPLEGLSHDWVAEWLRLIGLPGYVTTFSEARIDGRMLNSISMSDLDLLGVSDPFHLLSLKRAIQAFRMCGYGPNYLKDRTAASQGSQKLLHWTAQDVKNWLWNINLDQYIGALDNVGLHGALMLLEVRFTSESLARLLGIGSGQLLICKHLTKNFMELLGPVAAQKKLDAIQSKNFQCIIPSSEERGRRKARREKEEGEVLLCPLEQFPPVLEPSHLTVRPVQSLPLSSSSPVSRHST